MKGTVLSHCLFVSILMYVLLIVLYQFNRFLSLSLGHSIQFSTSTALVYVRHVHYGLQSVNKCITLGVSNTVCDDTVSFYAKC